MITLFLSDMSYFVKTENMHYTLNYYEDFIIKSKFCKTFISMLDDRSESRILEQKHHCKFMYSFYNKNYYNVDYIDNIRNGIDTFDLNCNSCFDMVVDDLTVVRDIGSEWYIKDLKTIINTIESAI